MFGNLSQKIKDIPIIKDYIEKYNNDDTIRYSEISDKLVLNNVFYENFLNGFQSLREQIINYGALIFVA